MDLSSKEGFLSKAKWILSPLSGILLWVSKFPSRMQIPKECPFNPYCIQPGLKTVICSQESLQNPNYTSFIINSYKLCSPSASPLPSSTTITSSLFRPLTHSSSWSSAMDDWIGTESGVLYMHSDHEEQMLGVLMDKEEARSSCSISKQNQRYAIRNKGYPPPIPLLEYPGWVLTRDYINGNLVLKEDTMKHQQYFEAIRENGRLILNLVHLEDIEKNVDLELEDLEFIKEKQEIEEEKQDGYQENEADDCDDEKTRKRSIMILDLRPKMPKTCLEEEDEEYGALTKSRIGRILIQICSAMAIPKSMEVGFLGSNQDQFLLHYSLDKRQK